MQTPKDKVTSIRLSVEDRNAIAQIKARYGVRHDIEAIRLALRLAVMDAPESSRKEDER
jgi:hypothetical protein